MWKLKGTPRTFIRDLTIKQFSDHKDQVVVSEKKRSQKYDVICLPIIDWSFRFQRPQQIMSRFAESGHRVFYVSTNFLVTNLKNLTKADVDHLIEVNEIANDIFGVKLVSYSNFNIYKDRMSNDHNLRYLTWSLEILEERMAMDNILLFVELPFWTPLVKSTAKSIGAKIIYDCMDDHSGFSTNAPEMFNQEEELSKMSHLVIASSNKLYKSQRDFNDSTILVKNGADFKHFSNIRANDLLSDLEKPIIGYYGAISDWFDVDIIEYCAQRKSKWSFVLIGSTFGADVSEIKKLPNVHLLGEKTYDSLPLYLYWFDACCIPFEINTLTESTNPVKFYEFLSAGKPVVSTMLPELKPYKDWVYLARDKHKFLLNIEKALSENDETRIKARIEFGKENDWSSRYALIEKGIHDLVFRKVSIIIVTYNGLAYNTLCLESIFKYTSYPNFEVIVVDNGSTDGTPDYLREMEKKSENVKVILNAKNEGFAKATNQGIQISRGYYIILLNNDIVVTENWLRKMVRYLEDPEIGLIGPVTNAIANEARIDISYNNLNKMHEVSSKYTKQYKDICFEIRTLAMFCIGMRRDLVDKVGLLDERFEVGMFEDDDYSRRARDAGLKVICAQDIFVHHFGKSSFGKLTEKEYLRIFEENRKRYEEKWSERWEQHKNV